MDRDVSKFSNFFDMFSGYVDDIDMLHVGKLASATISAKGGLNIDLNNRSTYLKISIEMPLIGLMASISAIVDLNNVPQRHTLLNKIGRIRTRQHQSIPDIMVMICRNFLLFSTRFRDMSMASTCNVQSYTRPIEGCNFGRA